MQLYDPSTLLQFSGNEGCRAVLDHHHTIPPNALAMRKQQRLPADPPPRPPANPPPVRIAKRSLKPQPPTPNHQSPLAWTMISATNRISSACLLPSKENSRRGSPVPSPLRTPNAVSSNVLSARRRRKIDRVKDLRLPNPIRPCNARQRSKSQVEVHQVLESIHLQPYRYARQPRKIR